MYIFFSMLIYICVCAFGEMVDLVNPTRCEKISGEVDKPKWIQNNISSLL